MPLMVLITEKPLHFSVLLSMIHFFLVGVPVVRSTGATDLGNTSCRQTLRLHRLCPTAVAHPLISCLYVFGWHIELFRLFLSFYQQTTQTPFITVAPRTLDVAVLIRSFALASLVVWSAPLALVRPVRWGFFSISFLFCLLWVILRAKMFHSAHTSCFLCLAQLLLSLLCSSEA